MIHTKRIYEPAAKQDGFRLLVDRLWPRGVSKAEAKIDRWLKAVAPSNELRTWFHYEESKWAEFERRYREELTLGDQAEALAELKRLANEHDPLTLLYGARDEAHNQAVVLTELLSK